MFDISKFEISEDEIRDAAKKNCLLSMEIEFNKNCNYNCPYCYAAADQGGQDYILPAELAESAIRQAAQLGARKIVIIGGEPLLFEDLEARIKLITELGMGAEIFTNGSLVNPENAAMFFKYGCRVVVKLNSLNAEIQERLTGIKNALSIAKRAVTVLKEAGFNSPDMLAASTVISSENLDGIIELWKYLRENAITPYFEMITPQGRLLDNKYLEVDSLVIKDIFEQISEIDRQYGYDWQPQPPLVGDKCLRNTYSCLINYGGDVFPCVGIDKKIGNIAERPLRIILEESHVIQDLKNYRNMIKGPCRNCDKLDTCYGCRGAAYQLTGDYLASDPLCWRNVDKLDQIVSLPVAATNYLPHQPPMAMVEQIIEVGPVSKVGMKVRKDNRFLDDSGKLDRAVIPEIVAQAGAAVDTFRFNGKIRPGFLAFGQEIKIHDDLNVDDELVIAFSEENSMEGWHTLKFSIVKQHNKICADGEITVCVF
ncbi:MAG: radical SAM protein [Victivallaceae bacterium]|jgi:radical SAM protein with 4Fe4S-binding SPASM domain|nr:radical SAM protein [Victivallaceae bacterium]MDD3116342.1 radical SAM protein [Victivallaceae bacterium]MDD4317305.1 radical SAM protein [Victivallaceae bacterium]